ncbi:MAG: glycosyltransferase family 39 protein [Acidimicrobiales bacterium]|jgi:hypothetical protein|nr:glycosyltransferase family 39 protein [Acidimicrobiales bacterium]
MHDASPEAPDGGAPTPSAGAPAPVVGRRADLAATLTIVVAVGAAALGIALRFATGSALWLDEALSVNIAELPIGELLDALRQDGHPPLYYVALHGWIELFGDGDAAVRALSGVVAVLTLPVAWWYGRRRGGPALGWLVLAVVALAPYSLRYATETRMYALVVLLVFVGAVLLDDVLARGHDGWGRIVGVALVGAALLYTHYWAIWLLGAVGLWLVWRLWRNRGSGSNRSAWRTVGALVVAGVAFLPWLPTLLYQSANTGTPWASPSRPTTVVGITLADFTAGPFADAGFIALVVTTVALLAVFGRGVDARSILLDLRSERAYRPEALLFVSTLGLGTAFTYLTWSAFATRYAAVVFPLFAVLVAAGLTRFLHAWVRLGGLAVVLALFAVGAVFNVTDERTQSEEWAAAIVAEGRPGDLVVYCPDQLGPAGSRELPDGFDQVVYPTFGSPERVDWVDYAARNAAADPEAFAAQALDRAGDRGIFVVWNGSYRTFDGQCEALVNAIAAARPARELVPDGGGRFFEHGTVTQAPGG